jgi:hypothetical protein
MLKTLKPVEGILKSIYDCLVKLSAPLLLQDVFDVILDNNSLTEVLCDFRDRMIEIIKWSIDGRYED